MVKERPPSGLVSMRIVAPSWTLPRDDLLRQRRLDLRLDGALQRPRAVDRVVAALGEPVLRAASVSSSAMLRSASRFRSRPSWMSTICAQVLAVERVEDDDLVDAVQELRPEVLRAAPPAPRRFIARRLRARAPRS